MLKNKFNILLLVFLLLGPISINAANRWWIATSTANWNSTANWSSISATGAGGASVPGASDIAIFTSNRLGSCTINSNVSVAGIDVQTGYTGTITQGAFTITIGTSNASFVGGTFTGGSATIVCNGSFTLNGTSFTSTTSTFTLNNTVTNTSGTFTHNGGTTIFGGTGAQIIPLWSFNSLTISGARTTNSITLAAGTISIAGTFTASATFTSGAYVVASNTISFNGAAQNIPAIPTTGYNNLTCSGTGNKTATGALVVNGGLTIDAGRTLTMGTANILSGTLTSISGTGSLLTGVPTATSATPIPASKTWTCTVEFNGVAQSVVAGTYTNLTCSGTGNKTATGALVVNGTLTINASRNLIMGTNLLSGTLTSVSGTGILQTAALGATPIPVGKTWTVGVLYNSASGQTIVNGNYADLNGTGGARTLSTSAIGIAGIFTVGAGAYTTTSSSIDFNGAAQNIPAIPTTGYNNLTCSGTGNKTATGALIVNGILTINSGRTLTMGTANVLSGTLSSISGTGSLLTGVPTATSATPIPASKTWTCTVEFNGVAQSVVAGTYTNLTCSGTGNKTATGALVVNGVLTINASRNLIMGTNLLSGTLTSVSGTGILQTAALGATPIPVGKTWTVGVLYNSASGQTIVNGNYADLNGTGGARTLSTSAIGIAGIFTVGAGAYTTTSSSIDFNGAAQNIPAIPTTGYNNLTCSGTGDKTSTGALIVNGNLTINTGRILTMNNAAHTLTGTLTSLTGTGKLRTIATGATPIPVSKTWPFTVEFNGATAQTVPIGTYTNLIVSGARTTTSVTLGSGTINITKTFRTYATFTTGSFINTGNTVSYNGTMPQSIAPVNYNNLTSTSTGVRSLATTGVVKVAGTFTKGTNTYYNYGSAGDGFTPKPSGTTSSLLQMSSVSATTAFVSGTGGVIRQTTDGGTTWLPQTSGTTEDLYGLAFYDANNGIAAGNNSTIKITSTAGATWSTVTSPVSESFRCVAYASSTNVFIGGGNGTILMSTNSGASFSTTTVPGGTSVIYGIYFTDVNTGYAVGWAGVILKTIDGGLNWVAQTSGVTDQLNSVEFTSATTGFAVGLNGRILRTTDGGSNWSTIASGTTDFCYKVDFYDSNNGYISGGDIANNIGTILKTSDGGLTWSLIYPGTSRLLGMALFNQNTGYIGGLDGDILKYTCCLDGSTLEFNGTIAQVVPLGDYGNLTISNAHGANTITLSSGTISLSGNYTNSITTGTMVTTGNTLLFSGTRNQYIGGTITGGPVLQKLSVNKPLGKVILSKPTSVIQQLILTKGVIGSSTTNILQINNNAVVADTVLGGSDSSYVSGPIKKIGNQIFTFPLGDTILPTGAFHPLKITAPSLTTDAFRCQYFAANQTAGSTLQPDSLDEISNCEYWTLTRDAGAATVIPSVGWNSTSCNIQAIEDLRVAGWDSGASQWKTLGNNGTFLKNNYNMLKGVSGLNLTIAHITIGTKFSHFGYATLKKQLDGGYYKTLGSTLLFKYYEEYIDLDSKLSYNIYDKTRAAVIQGTVTIKANANGDNRVAIAISSLAAGYYVLEVTNEKGELWKLRFKK